MVFILTIVYLMCVGRADGQEGRVNPRPVERPSRTVESLMKRGQEAKAEETKTETPLEEPTKKEKAGEVVFRVSGTEVWEVARQAGWKFFPKGARGALDGVNTVADVQPGLPLSVVQGPVLTQRRTPAGWGAISQNTFFLFTDANGRAKALAPGWTVRDLRLSGDPFRWITRPQAGAGSPSW